MALFKYFKKEEPFPLSDPLGLLSTKVPSSAIQAANKGVKRALDDNKVGKSSCHGQYESFSATEKATIAKYTMKIGITMAIRKLEPQIPKRKLKESTIRAWVNNYKLELHSNHLPGNTNVQVKKLESKKRGHPFLLGNLLDEQVQSYVLALRDAGAVINTAIVMAAAAGIV